MQQERTGTSSAVNSDKSFSCVYTLKDPCLRVEKEFDIS